MNLPPSSVRPAPPLGKNADSHDRARPKLALHSSEVVAVGLLAVVFFYYSAVLPLAPNEIWAHLKYGEWIVSHGELPEREPFSSFADPEAPGGSLYWLAEVIFYLVYHAGEVLAGGDALQRTSGGVQALRTWYALLMVLKVGLVLLALWRSARSLPVAIAGATLLVLWTLTSTDIARPQAFGEVFFAFLLWWMSAAQLSRWTWLVIPALLAVWANCHPSFLAGLGFLGLFWLGRMIEFARSRTARWRAAFWTSTWLWQGLAAAALAPLAATFLNPAGAEIYAGVAEMTLNTNMHILPGWKPLEFTWAQGEHVNFVGTLLVLVLSQALSPRALPLSRMMVLLAFAPLASFVHGMIPWWMMLAPWFAVVLWRDILAGLRLRIERLWAGQASGAKGVLAVLLLLAALLGSGGLPVPIGRRPPPLADALAPGTPWQLAHHLMHGEGMPELAEALRNYPDQRFRGRMFVQYDLADYLLWSLPEPVPLLVYSQAHVFPRQHWQDVRMVLVAHYAVYDPKDWAKVQLSWQDILQRDQVNLVVIDEYEHDKLADALRADPAWTVIAVEESTAGPYAMIYDVRLLIAVRKHPL